MDGASICVIATILATVSSATTSTCGDNEVYLECGSYCPSTCNSPPIVTCPPVCVAGCFCAEGYVKRTEDGPCIPVNNCPNAALGIAPCQENEVFSTCGSDCLETCDDSEPEGCPDVCLNMCVCKEGYIRETYKGQCILENACVEKK